MAAPTTSSVQAMVRVRPLNSREIRGNAAECLTLLEHDNQIVIGSDRSFTFDRVFPAEAPQRCLYDEAIAPLTTKFLEGFNVTILAYGQTGSGKTYSMGTALDGNVNTEHQGIVPRAIRAMYAQLPKLYPAPAAYTVTVSFLELYNEEVVDLLAPPAHRDANPLPFSAGSGRIVRSESVRIREDENGNIVWMGVKEEECATPDEVLTFLAKGSMNRTVGSTDMNMVSSRSHAIFSVTLRLTRVGADGLTERIACKFHFVDLAGSERLKKTHAAGARAKEGISINAGLLALGNVISALGDEARLEKGVGHVPYRDSKLTRLLQDSLGGNAQTLMLACVSPADSNFQETLNTLKYANRARNIKNKVAINAQAAAVSPVEVQQLRSQIARLKMELSTVREQYGLYGAGNATPAPPPSSAPSVADGALREKLAAMESNKTQLELRVRQLQKRIRGLEKDLVRVQAERDSVRFEQLEREQGARRASWTGSADGKLASPTTPTAVPTNPLVLEYLTKITHLSHELHERELELATLKHQAAEVSSAMAAADADAGGIRKSFRFVMPGSSSNDADDEHDSDADDSDVDEDEDADLHPVLGGIENIMDVTLESARSEARRSMAEFHASIAQDAADTWGEGPVLDAGLFPTFDDLHVDNGPDSRVFPDPHDPDREHDGDDNDAASVLDQPVVLHALDVPTWAKTPGQGIGAPSLVDGLGPRPATAAPVLGGGVGGGSGGSGDLGGGIAIPPGSGSGSDEGSVAAAVQPTKTLYAALHRIQADIAMREDLVAQLEEAQHDQAVIKAEYEAKLRAVQAQLAAVEAERDAALAKVAATERDKEREVKLKFQARIDALQAEVATLKRTHLEAMRVVNQSRHAETIIRDLRSSVAALKAEKQRLLRKMREDADRARSHAQGTDRELQKLRRKERAATETAKKWERNFELQKTLLKRRSEEAVTAQQKVKTLEAKLKRAMRASTGSMANAPMRGGPVWHPPVGGVGKRAPSSMGSVAMHMRRMSIASTVSSLNDIDEAVLEAHREQLRRDMEAVIVDKQRHHSLRALHNKRNKLMGERAELCAERDRIVEMEAEQQGTRPDYTKPQYMDDRIELIDAELAYLEERIKCTQDEITQDDMEADQNEVVEADGNGRRRRPSDSSPYERLCQLAQSLPRHETLPLFQQILDDFIETQVVVRNQSIEMRNLEAQNAELRKDLLMMRSAAMQTAIKYETKLQLQQAQQVQSQPQLPQDDVVPMSPAMSRSIHSDPADDDVDAVTAVTAPEEDVMIDHATAAAATKAAVDKLMEWSVFQKPMTPVSSVSPAELVARRSSKRSSRPTSMSSLSTSSATPSVSRPGSPLLSPSSGRTSSEMQVSSPLRVEAPELIARASTPNLRRAMTPSMLPRRTSTGSLNAAAVATATRRPSSNNVSTGASTAARRTSSYGSVHDQATGLTPARRLSQGTPPVSRTATPMPASPRDAVLRRSLPTPQSPLSPRDVGPTMARRTSSGSLSSPGTPRRSRPVSMSSLPSPTVQAPGVFERLATTPTAASQAKFAPAPPVDAWVSASRPTTPLGVRRGSGRALTPIITSRPQTPVAMGMDDEVDMRVLPPRRSPTPQARTAPRPHVPTPPRSRAGSISPMPMPEAAAGVPTPYFPGQALGESGLW
ncbi:Kinesin-like protein kif21a [Allomyces arbusculus]|nr:Kinesin-like protein kif21a [Allomyces arbusculus]